MIICGAEEPLGNNDILYVDEQFDDEPFPHDAEYDRVNRYSFVLLGESWHWIDFQPFLHALTDVLPAERTWLAAWDHDLAEFRRIPSLVRLSKHRKAGWEIYQEASDVFARIAATWDDPVQQPWDFRDPNGSDNCLLIGACPPLPELVASPLGAALGQMRHSSYIPMNRLLATWLADHDLSLICPRGDDVGRRGIVVVTPQRIPYHEMHAQGTLDLIETRDPSFVWRRSFWVP